MPDTHDPRPQTALGALGSPHHGGAALRDASSRRAGPSQMIPQFEPDSVSSRQRDHLDIQLDVNALSALVAAGDIRPPLSIGLFGDWGAGKTFFMDKMHARVAELDASSTPGFIEGIVQIRFNAWHYVEANLWASLIDTIFRSLEDAVRGKEGGDAQLETLRSRWQSALDEQRRAERELASVVESLERAQAERDRLRREKDEAEREALEARAQGKENLPLVSEVSDEIGKQLGPLLRMAGEELGIAKLSDIRDLAEKPINEAIEVLDQVEATGGRGVKLWRAFASSGLTPRQIVIGVIALVAPMSMVALLAYLQKANIRDWLAQPLTVLAEIAVMIATATQWVRGRIRRANDILDRLEAMRRELMRARDTELERRQKALDEAQARVDALGKELDSKQSEVDALVAKQQAARRELDDYTPARRMATFLSERVASDDYRKHLGIIALIRQDLQRLSELLALQDGTTPDGRLPSIRRIVLYVDDLDRCPPHRVVELLQAIHLLLAFPLFVVVVAVDARWISRALISHYPELLDDEEPAGSQATSYDYLEKIFQIPFWIRPLTRDASVQMVRGLLDGGVIDGSDTVPLESTRELAATRLEIKPAERNAMLALAGIAGRTPRALKRFINTYRLLKASMTASELAAFEPADGTPASHEYLAALVDLAVLVGYPHIADDFFGALGSASGPLHSLASMLRPATADESEWAMLLADLADLATSMPALTVEHVRVWAARVGRYSFRVAPGH